MANELTLEQWISCYGSAAASPYIGKVWRDEMALSDVPEELREETGRVVKNRNMYFGTWANREIPKREALAILTGNNGSARLRDTENLRGIIEQATASLPDSRASEAPTLFPTMKLDGSLIKTGTRINWNGTIKKAKVDLWAMESNNPDNAPDLWADIDYRSGIRIIPEIITTSLAFSEGELGWWGDVVYRSKTDANVFTPAQFADNWKLYTEE